MEIPKDNTYIKCDRGGKRLLVILLALLWGMEIGFKFASRTVIYLLNPCHVTTLIQVSIDLKIFYLCVLYDYMYLLYKLPDNHIS